MSVRGHMYKILQNSIGTLHVKLKAVGPRRTPCEIRRVPQNGSEGRRAPFAAGLRPVDKLVTPFR